MVGREDLNRYYPHALRHGIDKGDTTGLESCQACQLGSCFGNVGRAGRKRAGVSFMRELHVTEKGSPVQRRAREFPLEEGVRAGRKGRQEGGGGGSRWS